MLPCCLCWQSPRSSPLDLALTDYDQEPGSTHGLSKSAKMMNLSEEDIQDVGTTADKVRDMSWDISAAGWGRWPGRPFCPLLCETCVYDNVARLYFISVYMLFNVLLYSILFRAWKSAIWHDRCYSFFISFFFSSGSSWFILTQLCFRPIISLAVSAYKCAHLNLLTTKKIIEFLFVLLGAVYLVTFL